MKKHTEIYMSALGYDKGDFISSELSGGKATDIHHIENKGAGGDPKGEKDRIENLMALTRDEHIKYGDKKEYIGMLFKKHYESLCKAGVKFDSLYIFKRFDKYDEALMFLQ